MAWANHIMEPQPQHELTGLRPQLRHTWQAGDTIAEIGQRYSVDPEDILDFNLIEEHEIQPGDEIKIPTRNKAAPRSNKIRYEALVTPVEMHVNNPKGIQKYAFGNINSPNEISGTGHFPHATKIVIHGIAHVPVGNETLAYYMDGHAFGDFKKTSKINWNVGYAWSELTQGEYIPAAEPVRTILEEPDEPITMFDDVPEADVIEPELPEVDDVIDEQPEGVLMPLNEEFSPEKFLYEDDIELHELHERHAPIKRHANDPVWIIGTFWFEGVEYYQPGKNAGEVVRSSLLWPIPMDKVVTEDRVFDYSKRRSMTRQEQWWELLSRLSANYTKLMVYLKNKNKDSI